MPTMYQRVYEALALDADAPIGVDFQAIYSSLNEEEIEEDVRRRVRWERWDQDTPINGVPPETVKQRSDYAGGECYFIYVDEMAAYFQPHGPGEGIDPITPEELPDVAQAHVEIVVDTMLVNAIADAVKSQYQKMLSWRAHQEFEERRTPIPGRRRGSL